MTRDLLLFPLGTGTFGIWEQDISSVAAWRPLHRLPLSPKVVAGMTIIEDRGATIFDLAACLGMEGGVAQERTRFLLISDGAATAGYAVAGSIDTFRCDEDQVLPMPGPVRSPVVGTCVVRDGTVIPVIDIRMLHGRLQAGTLDVPVPVPPGRTAGQEAAADRSCRLITIGGERFCAAGGEITAFAGGTVPITALPYAGSSAEGVLYHEGAVVPVVDLGERIRTSGRAEGPVLLFVTVAGERYAVPVEEDHGELDRRDLQVLPLPPVARTSGFHDAVVRDGTVVPLLDLGSLVLPVAGGADAAASDAYAPASSFPDRFQAGSVEVLELSLLGALHAVPREEVKEVFPPVPFRRIPGLPEIVIGTAERGGRLLPVLDLAAIFGRRTRLTEQSRMLRLCNGDFHALVLIEEAGEDRILPSEMQRRVPIVLPHQVLYGCYLDGRAVRLILNVHALTVHFERTEIRELVASLAPLPEISVGKATLSAPEGRPAAADEEASFSTPAAQHIGAAGTGADRSAASAAALAAAARERKEREQAQAAAEEAREEQRRREEAAAREKVQLLAREAEQARAADEARLQEEQRARAEAEAAARAEEERRTAEAKQRAEAEERARREAEAAARAAAAEKEKREADERARQDAADAAARAAAEARDRAAAEERARAAEEERRASEEANARAAERQAAAEAEARRRSEERLREVVAGEAGVAAGGGQPAAGSSPAAGQRPVRSARARTVAAVIGAIIVLLLFWFGGGRDRGHDRREAVPPSAGTAAGQKSSPQSTREPDAPLVLSLPRSVPKPDAVVYVVVKGDTLWSISERFTGNPFNYPRVAKDNSIATPDLIFPGQRIRLEQKN